MGKGMFSIKYQMQNFLTHHRHKKHFIFGGKRGWCDWGQTFRACTFGNNFGFKYRVFQEMFIIIHSC